LTKKVTGLQVVQIGEMESIYNGINFGKTLKKKILYTLDKSRERVFIDQVS